MVQKRKVCNIVKVFAKIRVTKESHNENTGFKNFIYLSGNI